MTSERCLTTSKGAVVFSMYDYLKEIKIRPVLWDKDHVNRINRFMAWDDVVRSLVPYFNDLPIEEKQDLNSKMVKLWQYTTQVLMKTLKNVGDRKYRPYIYAHHMDFYLNNRGITLDEVGTPAQFEANDEIERKHWERRNNIKAKYTPENKLVQQEEQDGSVTNLPDDSSYDPMILCETTTRDDFNTTEHVYEQATGVENNLGSYNGIEEMEEGEDPDQDFLDSIKPFLNKLDKVQMLDFKIEFLQILKKYQSQNV